MFSVSYWTHLPYLVLLLYIIPLIPPAMQDLINMTALLGEHSSDGANVVLSGDPMEGTM